MSPDRFITVSTKEHYTYFTSIDIVTDKDRHTVSGGAWLAIVKSSLIDYEMLYEIITYSTGLFNTSF